jgi:ribonuclease HII
LLSQFVERNPPPGQTIYGIDEAGRGPLAGPLSLALVSFSPKILFQIESGQVLIGLNDSKKLSPSKREKLYNEILPLATWKHVFISNRSIDKFGISDCIYKGIQRLVRDFLTPHSYFLIDGNYKLDKRFTKEFSFSYLSIIKGDSKIITIAAASIVAKVKRDRYMRHLSGRYPSYRFDSHYGYGTASHMECIRTHGLTKYHRKTFYHPEEPSLFS